MNSIQDKDEALRKASIVLQEISSQWSEQHLAGDFFNISFELDELIHEILDAEPGTIPQPVPPSNDPTVEATLRQVFDSLTIMLNDWEFGPAERIWLNELLGTVRYSINSLPEAKDPLANLTKGQKTMVFHLASEKQTQISTLHSRYVELSDLQAIIKAANKSAGATNG